MRYHSKLKWGINDDDDSSANDDDDSSVDSDDKN